MCVVGSDETRKCGSEKEWAEVSGSLTMESFPDQAGHPASAWALRASRRQQIDHRPRADECLLASKVPGKAGGTCAIFTKVLRFRCADFGSAECTQRSRPYWEAERSEIAVPASPWRFPDGIVGIQLNQEDKMANDKNPLPVTRKEGGTLDDLSRPDGLGKVGGGDDPVLPSRQPIPTPPNITRKRK
jgi:hypothetical protein